MIKLFTDEEYEKTKGKDLFKLKCIHCNKVFERSKNYIYHYMRNIISYSNKNRDPLEKGDKKIIECSNCKQLHKTSIVTGNSRALCENCKNKKLAKTSNSKTTKLANCVTKKLK